MTEWVPKGQTNNQNYYLQALTTLNERVNESCINCWKTTLRSCIKTVRWLIMPYLLSSF